MSKPTSEAWMTSNQDTTDQVLEAPRPLCSRHPDASTVKNHDAREGDFSLVAAGKRLDRERAFQLGYRVYRQMGYLPASPRPLLVTPFDADPNTFILTAEDTRRFTAGTATLNFDGPRGLPCDETFEDALRPLRQGGRKLVEVSRLALDPSYRRSRDLLLALYIGISVFARRIRNATDFIIEVHPRHQAFYERLLSFELLSAARPCGRVKGAPAVLLRLDLSQQARIIKQVAGHGRRHGQRSLYQSFLPYDREPALASVLDRQFRPISNQECKYFDLIPESP